MKILWKKLHVIYFSDGNKLEKKYSISIKVKSFLPKILKRNILVTQILTIVKRVVCHVRIVLFSGGGLWKRKRDCSIFI